MSDKKITQLLNNIYNNYVNKNNKKKVKELIEDFDNDIILTDVTIKQEEKSNIYKLGNSELKDRLMKTANLKVNVIDLTLSENLTLTEIESKCSEILNRLNIGDKRNKKYYFSLGYYLRQLKSQFNVVSEFNSFMEKKYHLKLSTLKKYIRFTLLCDTHYNLLECDLTFKEIMNNIPEIIKIYKNEDFVKQLNEKYAYENDLVVSDSE